MKNECEDSILRKQKWMWSVYYKQLYANSFNNFEEMEKFLLNDKINWTNSYRNKKPSKDIKLIMKLAKSKPLLLTAILTNTTRRLEN